MLVYVHVHGKGLALANKKKGDRVGAGQSTETGSGG